MASVPSSLPAGTVLRYAACGDQPRRTLLVLNDGRLKCLRVGDRTHKGNRLPTFPSLAAFLDIVPRHDNEEFTVEWGNLINEDLLTTKMRDTLKCMGIRDDDDPQRIYSFCEGYTEMSVEMAEENKAACERYLQSLGLTAGESPEGGYVFYRAAEPPQLLMPQLLAAAPTEHVLSPCAGGGNSVFGKLPKRAGFQEPLPVTPPAPLRIPQSPWQTVTLAREQLHRLLVLNGGKGLTEQAWEVIANEHAS